MKAMLALPLALTLAAAAHATGHPGPGPGPGHGPGPGPGAARGFHGAPMDNALFPPDLILSNQIALGLTEEQTAAIKKGINETHQKVLDVQTRLQRVTEQLHDQLVASRVDEASALKLAAEAMDLEKEVKTAHMTLLIRIKNLLTPEQIEKASALRPRDDARMKMRQPMPGGSSEE